MTYLILVLPCVLVDLVRKERRMISAAIDSAAGGDPLHAEVHGLPHVEVPCEAIIVALLVFLKWFMLVRSMELLESEIAELTTRRGIAMMEKAEGSVPRKIWRSAGLEVWEVP